MTTSPLAHLVDWGAIGWTVATLWKPSFRDPAMNAFRWAWERLGRGLLWLVAVPRIRLADLLAGGWIATNAIADAPRWGETWQHRTADVAFLLVDAALVLVIYGVMRHAVRHLDEQAGRSVMVLSPFWGVAVMFAAVALGPHVLALTGDLIDHSWANAGSMAAEFTTCAVLWCEPPKRTAPAAIRARWAERRRLLVPSPMPG